MPRQLNHVYDPTNLYESGDRIFRLTSNGDSITLELVDADGKKRTAGNIVAIRADGYLQLYSGCNKRAGLKLNENGQIETRSF